MSEIQNGTEKRPFECRTYTVNDVARILGVSRTQAYRLVQEGLFKSVRIGNAIRIPKRSFDKWLELLDPLLFLSDRAERYCVLRH